MGVRNKCIARYPIAARLKHSCGKIVSLSTGELCGEILVV